MIKFRPQVPANERAALHREFGHQLEKDIPQIDVHAVRIPPGKTADEVIARYKDHPGVEFAEAEEIFAPALLPNDPWYYAEPVNLWHLPVIGAPAAWDITTGSSIVIIAILDTGVYGDHPDLQSKMVGGWNVIDDNSITTSFVGHGTLVAGQAAAASNNGIGVAAPAWGCKIMPIVVSKDGWTGSVSLAEGVIWAADHGSRIANMSFEIFHTSVMTTAAQYMRDHGGIVVQSAGNSATVSTFPDDPLILKVSGTDWYDRVWSSSCTGTDIDVGAPATDIGTTNDRGTYSFGTGTSASAPIVSGVAALMFSVNPALTGEQVMDILEQSADDLGPPGWDPGYGWGRINAARAVQMARDSGEPLPDTIPPTAAVSQPVGGTLLSGSVTVAVTATDNVGVSRVDLYVDSVLISSDTVTPHQWQFDTRTLTNATHWVWAKALDAAGNESSPAGVQVTVDNAAPTVTLSAPGDGAVVTGTVTVSASASDNLGLARVEFYRDAGVLLGSDTSSPYSVFWNTGTTTNGAHALYARAFDLAGNVTTSVSRTVTVGGGTADTTPPTVSITSPLNGAQVATKSSVSISASATDNVAVQRVEFYVESVLKCTDTAAPFACTWQVPPQRGRTYRLQAKAFDPGGNVGTSPINTVTSR